MIRMYSCHHIAAYYRFKAMNEPSIFGRWNLMDLATRYSKASSIFCGK